MPEPTSAPVSKTMLWAGWITSALPALMLLFSGVMKLAKPEAVVKGFAELGWPDSLAPPWASSSSLAPFSTRFPAPPSWRSC